MITSTINLKTQPLPIFFLRPANELKTDPALRQQKPVDFKISVQALQTFLPVQVCLNSRPEPQKNPGDECSHPAALYEQGRQRRQEDPSVAFAYFKLAAMQGYEAACLSAAECCLFGQGTSRSLAEARRLLRCALPFTQACKDFEEILNEVEEVETEKKTPLQSCLSTMKLPQAHFYVFLSMRHLPQYHEKAFEACQQAAKQNYMPAMMEFIHHLLEPASWNPSLALEYATRAAQIDAGGRYFIARSEIEGWGRQPNDPTRGWALMKILADEKLMLAQKYFADHLMQGKETPIVEKDALKYLRHLACFHRQVDACFLMIKHYSKLPLAEEIKQSRLLTYYKIAAEEGDRHAQYKLALCYDKGKGVAADPILCREWLNKSVAQQYCLAQFKLAHLHRYSSSPSLLQAVYLYKDAFKNEPQLRHLLAEESGGWQADLLIDGVKDWLKGVAYLTKKMPPSKRRKRTVNTNL